MEPQTPTPAPEPTPIVTPVEPPKPKSKLPIILVGILLLLIVGAGGFIAGSQMTKPTAVAPSVTPTLTPRNNWLTYVNTKYGFYINYPPNWGYLEVPTEIYTVGENQVWFSPTTDGWPPPNTGAMAPVVFMISESDFSKKWNPEHFDNYQNVPYVIGNIQGQKISGTNKQSMYAQTVVLTKIGNYYLQIMPNGGEASDSHFDQILSTFRFLPSSSDAKKKAEIHSILVPGLEIYRAEHQVYPNTLEILLPDYLVVMPKDSSTNANFKYQIAPSKLDYSITTILEDGTPYIVNSPHN